MTDLQDQAKIDDPTKTSEIKRKSSGLFPRRLPLFLDFLNRLFDHPEKRINSYIKRGHVIADLGCGWGFYSFALADSVGPEGKVYSVDLDGECIETIRKKASSRGYANIEAHTSTAADLSYIPDESVDLVFANGLLCAMASDRDVAIDEMKRILKPTGVAFLSGLGPPPLGYVDEAEWKIILSGFNVVEGGSYKEQWAIVSHK